MGTTILGGFLYPQTRAKFELHFKETEDNLRRISKCPTISKVCLYDFLYIQFPRVFSIQLHTLVMEHFRQFMQDIQFIVILI